MLDLIRFHRTVYVIRECKRAIKANEPQHHEEGVRYNRHVPEVVRYLEYPVHVGSMEEEVERISENKQSCRATIEKG